VICAREGCGQEFSPTTHNNIFCSDECCKIATLEKARRLSQDKRDRLSGKKRTCSSKDCNGILSRYNETNVCELCKIKEASKQRASLLEMIGL
jgi:hypothetical protein